VLVIFLTVKNTRNNLKGCAIRFIGFRRLTVQMTETVNDSFAVNKRKKNVRKKNGGKL
jgi:hypothetical protein